MASRIGRKLLGSVVPHYERWRLQGAAHNAAQDDIAASLDIAIGLTQNFGARNCKEKKRERERDADRTYYDMLTITRHMMMIYGQQRGGGAGMAGGCACRCEIVTLALIY